MEKSELIELIKCNKNIVYRDNFLDNLKSESLIDFRNKVNLVQSMNATLKLEDSVNAYYDKLISQFDLKNQMFRDYYNIFNYLKEDNYNELVNYVGDIYFINSKFYNDIAIYFDKLEDLKKYLLDSSNKKLGEIIIDRLFRDTFYNVLINIREMIRYNNLLPVEERILDNDLINFYNNILNIDKISCNDKIKLYNNLKDKNIHSKFYQHLRALKDLSYRKINDSMIKIDKNINSKDDDLSLKYGLDIYNLMDSEYQMLISSSEIFQAETSKRMDCYSLISNENTSYYKFKDCFIYGYNSFNPEYVIHVFERDAGTIDIKNKTFDTGTTKVNRLMTSNELITNEKQHSEINIVNLDNNEGGYTRQKPDFLVVFENITKRDVEEAKRLNIPITIIKQNVLEKNSNSIEKRRQIEEYTDNDAESIEQVRRSYR